MLEDGTREMAYDDLTWNPDHPIASDLIGYKEFLPRWNYWEELKEVVKN